MITKTSVSSEWKSNDSKLSRVRPFGHDSYNLHEIDLINFLPATKSRLDQIKIEYQANACFWRWRRRVSGTESE